MLVKASRAFPALILTGPRRAGKTTLLRNLFPGASYILMEDPDLLARFRDDPRTFLDDIRPPAILDEIQNVPEILSYLRSRIDSHPARKGQWFLTGSQEVPLMRGATESMAGRAAVFQLLPFSVIETGKTTLLKGGFPEVLARPSDYRTWYSSYLQTYLEKDVRTIAAIRHLSTFRKFLSILSSRCGKILNRTDIAAPLGVSVPTVSEWLNILEITAQIILVPPFFENFGKRLVKSPKLYFMDSGLACHLLGIESEQALGRSPFLGPLFEGFVASEIIKSQINSGRRREIYHFRDQQGLEVDFVVPTGDERLVLIEAKASRSVAPESAEPLLRLARTSGRYRTKCVVIHRRADSDPPFSAIRPGASAASLTELPEILKSGGR
ncbi:MAG: ATP-binding protein [Deltaproteobacteria bacterium]|nr:ATP-binding protein [Deltaproteobacteria bacterium]